MNDMTSILPSTSCMLSVGAIDILFIVKKLALFAILIDAAELTILFFLSTPNTFHPLFVSIHDEMCLSKLPVSNIGFSTFSTACVIRYLSSGDEGLAYNSNFSLTLLA